MIEAALAITARRETGCIRATWSEQTSRQFQLTHISYRCSISVTDSLEAMATLEEMSARHTVLLAMDDSVFAEYALESYMKHARRPDDEVVVLYVPDVSNMFKSQTTMAVHDPCLINDILVNEKKKLETILSNITSHVNNHLTTNTTIRGRVPGKPGQEICRVAEELNARLIVVGSRGHGLISRTFLGSVSDYVVHHASVPVLVCKMPEAAK